MDQSPADSQHSQEPANGISPQQLPQQIAEANLPVAEICVECRIDNRNNSQNGNIAAATNGSPPPPQTQETPKISSVSETLVETDWIEQKPEEKSVEVAPLAKKDVQTPDKLEELKQVEITSSDVIDKPKISFDEHINLLVKSEVENDGKGVDESKGEHTRKADEFSEGKIEEPEESKKRDDADGDIRKNVTTLGDKAPDGLSEDNKEKIGDSADKRANTVKDENGFTYYKCRFCGLTFNYMNTLRAHERVHDIIQPYTCNNCGEAFHFMCELEYHKKQHEKHKGYKCECGRTFYQYTELLNHKHPGEDDPNPMIDPDQIPLPQPVLAAAFNASSSQILPRSYSVIDASHFPFPEFAVEGYEPKHPLKVYSEVRMKPYICQYCSKSYADSRGLSYHMYSHRGERSFNPRASRYLMCRNDNSYISPGADF